MFSMMMMEASTIAPIATAMPPGGMMLVVTLLGHRAEGEQDPEGQRQNRNQRAPCTQQEHEDDQADDDHQGFPLRRVS